MVLVPGAPLSGLLSHRIDPVVDAEREEVLRGLLRGGGVVAVE